jgi:hypothetical protein
MVPRKTPQELTMTDLSVRTADLLAGWLLSNALVSGRTT